MEVTSTKVNRIFRTREQIDELLKLYATSGLSIKSFCAINHIPTGSFHNWQKRFVSKPASCGFATVKVAPLPAAMLFAEVNGVKLYQPVSAAYLKELLQ
jgi:hypothetical protein